jgi:hypothetical protein
MSTNEYLLYGIVCIAFGSASIYFTIKAPTEIFWDVNIRGYLGGIFAFIIGLFLIIHYVSVVFFP